MIVDRRVGVVGDRCLVALRARYDTVDSDGAAHQVEVCWVRSAPIELVLGVRVVAIGTIRLPQSMLGVLVVFVRVGQHFSVLGAVPIVTAEAECVNLLLVNVIAVDVC